MFFFASKLLGFLLQPVSWLLVLLLGAFAGPRRWRKRMIGAALVFVGVGTNPLLKRWAFSLWEPPGILVSDIKEPYDYGIVLGGLSNSKTEPKDRLYFNSNGNRLTQAIELFRQGKIRQILFTGGLAPSLGEHEAEAGRVRRYLKRIGFPMHAVRFEEKSRNTYENAVFAWKLLEPERKRGKRHRTLLLTDGFHMRRAQLCFRKAGFRPDSFCTSRIYEPAQLRKPETYLFPDPVAFWQWGRLTREWAGLFAYKLSGKI